MALSEEIKGISVKIGANTTELSNALKTINSEVKNTGANLKDINKLLKLDPTNTELLTQKQKALKDAIAESKLKVDALKQAQKQAKDMLASGKIDQGAYDQLARDVIRAEQSTKQYKEDLKDTNEALKNHKKNTDDAATSSGKFGEVLKGVGTAALAVTTAVAGAAVALGKEVVGAYADYEQLIGGVETLFGQSADKVSKYANEAFKTTGLSANEYMETVTSFSASLLQSMGGDTEAAADKADRALRDMSDNANKMGTDMASIQNAYQGFAKQNYTMLDNLKLGYGGTKEEMQRLLNDAKAISGVDYDISSYADIIDAIGVIQDKMGITGTTAKEAEATISGSINMLSSSYKNLITGIGDPAADVQTLVDNVMSSLNSVLTNITPIVENIIATLPSVFEALTNALIEMLPTLLETITGLFESVLQTLVEALPEILPVIFEAVMMISSTLIENLPLIIESAIQIILSLIQGLNDALPDLIEMVPEIIVTIVTTLIEHLPEILAQGVEIIVTLVVGLINAIPQLIEALPQIIDAIVNTFKEFDWKTIGTNIMDGLISGITNAVSNVISTVKNVGNKIKNTFEDLFDINSPSRWMREQIGKNLDLGLAEGIERYKSLAVNTAKSVSGAVAGAFSDNIAYDLGSSRSSSIAITTPIYLDGKVIATVVNTQLGVML